MNNEQEYYCLMCCREFFAEASLSVECPYCHMDVVEPIEEGDSLVLGDDDEWDPWDDEWDDDDD